MSSIGTKKSLATREKMRLAKQKHTIPDLIQAVQTYLTSLDADPSLLPSLAQLCLLAHCSRPSLLEYSTQSPELQTLIDEVNLRQEVALLKRGDLGKNPAFPIFLLKSKHGYNDTPQTLTQNNTFNISPDLLADALALMQKSP